MPFELDEFKLRPPAPQPGLVTRSALLDRLGRPPLLAVVAPAGYGKTTVLAQWVARQGPRVAWLSVDERDDDPAVFLTYLAAALDRIEPLDVRGFRSLATPGSGLVDLMQLVSAVARMDAPVTLVVDRVEALTGAECRDMLAELAVRLPAGCGLALGSQEPLPLSVGRLRAHGSMVEIGVPDLAMDVPEARSLLDRAGVELGEAELQALVDRTEGWPVGLYLAALAINAGSPEERAAFTFSGDERFMRDYLRSEFLDRVSRSDAVFLTRTAVLGRLTGPLCDATVGGRGASRVLARLAHSNLLVVPLDRRGLWYRYHHLFRDLLRSELGQREPEMVAELHTRAASWYESDGQPEVAIEHAQLAGDTDRVARLFLALANPAWASGRLDTVIRWMDWFANRGEVEHHPSVAVHGALIYALSGKAGDAERWADAAERTTTTGLQSDGNTMEGALAYLRALLCRRGPDEMVRDARAAMQGLGPTSPYRAAMLHAVGVASLLQGDLDQADVHFSRALDEAISADVAPFVPVLLAERGIVAQERGDRRRAEALAHEALQLNEEGQFDDYWTSALVFAWCARMAAQRGAVPEARALVARATRLRTLLTHALPMVAVQALLQLAHTFIALGDPGGARAVLGQLDDIHRHRPALGTLDRVEEVRTRLTTLRGEMFGLSSLTTAELRLLPLLPTHLSLAEIGERLFVSRNTVKTQAISVYRKLGVSHRGEAIARMAQLGLVAGDVIIPTG